MRSARGHPAGGLRDGRADASDAERPWRKIRFDFGTLTLDAELADTPTAQAVLAKLPYDARVMTWGEEVYFDVPVTVRARDRMRARS